MLSILLNDTTIPKIFVGDPKQAIYEWRGSINSFEKLPEDSLIVEFYSTFRIGNPACDLISSKFDNCWMITKNKNETKLDYEIIPETNYVYLFRTWKGLLKTAETIPNIWINDFEKQITFMKNFHSKLKKIKNINKELLNEFSDDLPSFLLKLSEQELLQIINNIEKNIVDKKKSTCQMYTIHSYKGLENDIIRINSDIYSFSKTNTEKNNLLYVALTRGKKHIIVDKEIVIQKTIDLNVNNNTDAFNVNTNTDEFNVNTYTTDCGHNIEIKEILNNKLEINISGPKVIDIKKIVCKKDYQFALKKAMDFLNKKDNNKKDNKKSNNKKSDQITLELFLSGKTITEISEERKLKEYTIYEHIIKNIPHESIKYTQFMTEEQYVLIKDKYTENNKLTLKELKDSLPKDIKYHQIKIVLKL